MPITMNTTKKLIFISFLTLCVQAHNDDDDDDMITEAMIHALLGAATEICLEHETCSRYLHGGAIVLGILLVIVIIGDILVTGEVKLPSAGDVKRAMRNGAAAAVGAETARRALNGVRGSRK